MSILSEKYYFKRVYYAWTPSNNIYDLFKAIRYLYKFLMIIETKEGNIFGCFIDSKNNDKNFIFNILTEEFIYDNKLEVGIEGQYNWNRGAINMYVKNHLYLVKDFLYSNNNKFFSNKLKMKEKKFTCRLIEVYEVN